MKLSFEELPQAVSDIFLKLSNIEKLLQEKNSSAGEQVELLTIKEAAKLLNVSVPTIYGYVHEKEIPYSKVKKRLYFSKQELTEWVKSSRRKTIAEINASAEESLQRRKK